MYCESQRDQDFKKTWQRSASLLPDKKTEDAVFFFEGSSGAGGRGSAGPLPLRRRPRRPDAGQLPRGNADNLLVRASPESMH